MVKKSVKAEINSFVKGLITEASPLNFPENASVVDENFEIKRDGSRRRRYGLDLEYGHTIRNLGVTYNQYNDFPFSSYVWKNAGGIKDRDFLMFQSGNTMFVFELKHTSISSTGFVTSLDLSGIGGLGKKFYMVSVDNKLVMAAGTGLIAVISYNGSTFSLVGERIKVRDQWGLQYDPTDNDPYLRPSSPPDVYRYNLYNQSWGIPRRYNTTGAARYDDPLSIYNGTYSKLPSNSETVWLGLQTLPNGNDPALDVMVTYTYNDLLGSQTLAPKGYFIIDLLNRGTSRKQAVIDNAAKFPELDFRTFEPNTDQTVGGASCVCEYAGRVFYSGFDGHVIDGDAKSPDLGSYVAFSQLVKSFNDIFRCYQEGDPTSRGTNDIVDTDGGLIRLSNAKNIIQMVDIGTALIVFAKNGVWSITGGSDYGFSATNYKTDQITTLGAISADSVIVESNKVYYWSSEGIVVIGRDQTGILTSQNISLNTIQSLYNNISQQAKETVFGVYDGANKKLRWMYREGGRTVFQSVTYELVFDLLLNAFTVNKTSPLTGHSYTILGAYSHDTKPVLAHNGLEIAGKFSVGYIIATTAASIPVFSLGYYNNIGFRDLQAIDGIGSDAEANLITGKITAQDSAVMKQVPYLVTHFKQTEQGWDSGFNPVKPSGCLIRAMWDFTNSESSNKWGSFFQAYRYRRAFVPTHSSDANGYDLVTSKSKLRGSGKAISLHFKSEPYKDCKLIGWNISINGNAVT